MKERSHYEPQHPRFRRGSPFRPTFAQREHSIEHYLSDHPYATYLEAAKIIDTLSKDWIEEHI